MLWRNFTFYRFVNLENHYPHLRSRLLTAWTDIGVTGRVYLAKEGVNAYVSVPRVHMESFETSLVPVLGKDVYFNDALPSPDGVRPFSKLHVRWRSTLGE